MLEIKLFMNVYGVHPERGFTDSEITYSQFQKVNITRVAMTSITRTILGQLNIKMYFKQICKTELQQFHVMS